VLYLTLGPGDRLGLVTLNYSRKMQESACMSHFFFVALTVD